MRRSLASRYASLLASFGPDASNFFFSVDVLAAMRLILSSTSAALVASAMSPI
jgi:hypothetical protein